MRRLLRLPPLDSVAGLRLQGHSKVNFWRVVNLARWVLYPTSGADAPSSSPRNEPPHGGGQSSHTPPRRSAEGDAGNPLRLRSAGSHLHAISQKKGGSVISCHNTAEHQSATSRKTAGEKRKTFPLLTRPLLPIPPSSFRSETWGHQINVHGVKDPQSLDQVTLARPV